MKRFVVLVAFDLVLLANVGCRNECQQLCTQLADYADECGYTVSDGDVDQCIADHGAPKGPDAQACAQYSTPQAVREEWDCEEMGLYFSAE